MSLSHKALGDRFDHHMCCHDHVRHGTTTLFAALELATGKVTDACYPLHRSDEFLRFLKHVAKAYPRVKLHLVVDNYATHTHPSVQAWP
jgi:hypothetical protein